MTDTTLIRQAADYAAIARAAARGHAYDVYELLCYGATPELPAPLLAAAGCQGEVDEEIRRLIRCFSPLLTNERRIEAKQKKRGCLSVFKSDSKHIFQKNFKFKQYGFSSSEQDELHQTAKHPLLP